MKLLSLVAAGLWSAVLPAQTADTTGTGWHLERLDLDVTVDAAAGTITTTGKARLRLELPCSTGPTLATRHFDFTSVAAADAEIDTSSRHPTMESIRLARIRLPQPATRGDLVDVDFATAMRESAGQLHVDADIALASWTMAWYPLPLPPDGEGYSPGHVRVAGTTRLHLPKGWRAVSDGRRSEVRTTDAGAVEEWVLDEPLARSFAAGPYRVGTHAFGTRSYDVYRLGVDAADASEQAASLGAAIAAMEKRFGPFPFASYGIAEIPSGKVPFYGASQQSFLMADSSAFRYGKNLPLFAHEAAHAWWGNTVGTRGPGGIICSETLAQYGAVIAIETLEGPAAATGFLRFSRRGYSPWQCARGYFGMARKGEDKPLAELESGGWQHNLSDAKGPWVFHMLRRRVGDELFFATLRGVVERHRGNTICLDDLRGAFVAAAPPGCALETFFAQWLDRAGAPELEPTWHQRKDGDLELTIAQRQAGEPYDLRLELAVHYADGSEARHEVHVTAAEQTFALPAAQPIESVALDPDHRLLVWTPEYGAAPSTDDPVVAADARAGYLGTYVIDATRTLEVVERGERLGARMGSKTLRLRHVDGHRFRSDSGVLEFVLQEGRVVAIEFVGDDGRRERATRKQGRR